MDNSTLVFHHIPRTAGTAINDIKVAKTVHHLCMAHLKGHEAPTTYEEYRARYQECIRMLDGMERALEKQLPEPGRRWSDSSVREDAKTMDPPLVDFLNSEPWYMSSHDYFTVCSDPVQDPD